MKQILVLLLATLSILLAGCSKGDQRAAHESAATNRGAVTTESPQPPVNNVKDMAAVKVTKEMAVATAKADYIRRKGSLKGADFDVSDDPDGWRISFFPRVRNGTIAGGGSDYLIDKETGKILSLKLHQ
ncbi:MAG: hypothetical protein ABW250_14235 [Pyrinomonadaceae bacterium]